MGEAGEFHNHRGAQLFQGLNIAISCHSFDNNQKQTEIWAFDIGLKQEIYMHHTLHRVATIASMTSGGHSNVISFRWRSAIKKATQIYMKVKNWDNDAAYLIRIYNLPCLRISDTNMATAWQQKNTVYVIFKK